MLAHPVLEQMLDAVWHRGADSRGLRTASGIALGWRGEGPAFDADMPSTVVRTVLAVADTALANAPELRAALTRAGRPVHHTADAELLAHAYDEWGDRCIERLQGAFAVAIWDGRRRRLLLASDRTASRPLYYALLHGRGVVFASTIRALLQDPGVSREWSPAALDAYLAYGAVPAPLTPYERISKLEPAQRLIVEGRRLHVERYWSPSCPAHRREGDGGFASRLQQIVGTEPASAGVLYSGGPASASLVACAPDRRVVTVGVDQDTRDLARAHALAQALGADPVLEIAPADITSLAAEVAACLDEPSANPSLVGQLAVFRAAGRHVDRALSGHGAQALWSDRAPLPSAWPSDDRFALYTRRFATDVHDKPPARPQAFDGVALAGRVARFAGIELSFPHLDPALISLASGGRVPGMNPVREFSGQTPRGPRRRRPEHAWITATVNALAPTLLLDGRFDGRGMVLPSALRQLWDDHRLGRQDHTRRFWSLLMLELWFREYIDGGGIEMPLADQSLGDGGIYDFARAA